MKITFDTNIFISRNITAADFPSGFYLSSVVLQELVAGAPDATAIKELDVTRRAYEKQGRILVPTLDDWWEVGKIINSLQRGRKSRHAGLTPKISSEEGYRITHDVLIARTAHRAGVTVITDNIGDFQKIRAYCRVQVISGHDYFDE